MSHDQIPYFLLEAQMVLYPATADGTLLDAAVWWGGPANQLRLEDRFVDAVLAASGDKFDTRHPVNETHRLEIAKTWLVRKSDGTDFSGVRGTTYLLQVTWFTGQGAQTFWKQRTYLGVTLESGELHSAGTLEFGQNLVFNAQQMVPAAGTGLNGATLTPVPPAGAPQDLPFFREELLTPGDYLLGFYQWPSPVAGVSATAVGLASQNTDTVLGLEVAGVQTGFTVTLPQGAANTAATGTVNLTGLTIPANGLVRWKVLSGPADAPSQAWQAAVVMQIQ